MWLLGCGAQPKEDIFAPPKEEKKKPRGEVIKYTAEFLHSLSEVPALLPDIALSILE